MSRNGTSLEGELAEIKGLLLMVLERIEAAEGKKPINGVDEMAYRRALQAAHRGDKSKLLDYLARGGKVPMGGDS